MVQSVSLIVNDTIYNTCLFLTNVACVNYNPPSFFGSACKFNWHYSFIISLFSQMLPVWIILLSIGSDCKFNWHCSYIICLFFLQMCPVWIIILLSIGAGSKYNWHCSYYFVFFSQKCCLCELYFFFLLVQIVSLIDVVHNFFSHKNVACVNCNSIDSVCKFNWHCSLLFVCFFLMLNYNPSFYRFSL